jgi:diguanylate cyclase (GGDEF)-like protein
MTTTLYAAPATSRVRAIVLGDPRGCFEALARELHAGGFRYEQATTAVDAIRRAEEARSAVLIVSDEDLAQAPALGMGIPGRRTLVIAGPEGIDFSDGTGVAAVLPEDAVHDRARLEQALEDAARDAGVSRRKETMLRWLERESERDSLTGLHNREAFDDALASICRHARETGEHVAVLVIDVLGTKMVNEAFGRDVGNELIKRASAGVVRCIRTSDVAARLSGDDFGVILPGATIDTARQVARRILHHMEEMNDGEWAEEIPVTLAFGVASGKGCTPGELLAAATARIAPHHHLIITDRPSWAEGQGPSVA